MSHAEPGAIRPIIAKNQVRLSAGRGLRLAMSGMSYRMFRSSVTISILALATAFLVHMLSYGLLEQATERSVFRELSVQRQLGQEITRLSEVDSDSAMLDALANQKEARLVEYSRWSGLGDAKATEACAIARRLREAARAFGDFPVAARAALLGDATAQDLLLSVGAGELGRLEAQLHQLGLRAPLGGLADFRRLVVDELPRLRTFLKAAQLGQRRAIDDLAAALAGKSITEVLEQSAAGQIEKFRAAGYALTSQDLSELSRWVSRIGDIAALNRLLQKSDVSIEVGRQASIDASRVNFETVSEYVTSSNRAQAIIQRLIRAGSPSNITAARLLELSTTHRREIKLARALGDQDVEPEPGWFGLSERNQWLVVLSFLVCVVGVANAMLMSVTERFTEIATMKCLGAMDGFVMLMFVFEAMIQGVVGGIIGALLGVVLAAVRAAAQFGSLLASASGVAGPVGLAMAASLGVGVALAAIAAVGPAFLAARLSPMEAMRVE